MCLFSKCIYKNKYKSRGRPRIHSRRGLLSDSCLIFTLLISPHTLWAQNSSATQDNETLSKIFALHKIDPSLVSRFRDSHPEVESAYLPTKKIPWAASAMPLRKGGANWQWRKKNKFTVESDLLYYQKDEQEIKDTTIPELSKNPTAAFNLSAAEKFDLSIGKPSFPFSKREWYLHGPLFHGRPRFKWEGFCNGIAIASLILPEPKFNVYTKSPLGVTIVFGPQDLKTLAAVSLNDIHQNALLFLGPQVLVWDILLRSFIKGAGKTFIYDSAFGPPVYNEVVVGYERKVIQDPSNRLKQNIFYKIKYIDGVDPEEGDGYTLQGLKNGVLIKEHNWLADFILDEETLLPIDAKWSMDSGPDFIWFYTGSQSTTPYPENPILQWQHIQKLFAASQNANSKKNPIQLNKQ